VRETARLTLMSLVLALVLASSLPALAGSVTVWPGDFRPANEDNYYLAPFELSSGYAGEKVFFAPLKLPAGAVITGVEYVHRGIPAPASTGAWIVRAGFGQVEEVVAQGFSEDASGQPVVVPMAVVAGMEKVKGRARYAVQVTSSGTASKFLGIRVTYR
jgi:hypothetical protein